MHNEKVKGLCESKDVVFFVGLCCNWKIKYRVIVKALFSIRAAINPYYLHNNLKSTCRENIKHPTASNLSWWLLWCCEFTFEAIHFLLALSTRGGTDRTFMLQNAYWVSFCNIYRGGWNRMQEPRQEWSRRDGGDKNNGSLLWWLSLHVWHPKKEQRVWRSLSVKAMIYRSGEWNEWRNL